MKLRKNVVLKSAHWKLFIIIHLDSPTEKLQYYLFLGQVGQVWNVHVESGMKAVMLFIFSL